LFFSFEIDPFKFAQFLVNSSLFRERETVGIRIGGHGLFCDFLEGLFSLSGKLVNAGVGRVATGFNHSLAFQPVEQLTKGGRIPTDPDKQGVKPRPVRFGGDGREYKLLFRA
jgi:hypothetical protein